MLVDLVVEEGFIGGVDDKIDWLGGDVIFKESKLGNEEVKYVIVRACREPGKTQG